jgi:hypothetical protein
MKKTFTLIIASFIVFFLMAQTAKQSFPGHKKQKGIEALGHKNIGDLDFRKHQPASNLTKSQSTLKSVEILKQRLDSIVTKELDSFGNLGNSYKDIYIYDAKGNETSNIYYEWDESTGKWIGSEKGDFTRDSNGNIILNIWYNWDDILGKWAGTYKYETTYDVKGNATLEISYNWDETTKKWVGSYKYENTYDAKGNQILRINYNWDDTTNKWIGSGKRETTYDANGNETLTIYYNWDTTSSSWVLSGKNEYTYDPIKNITASIYSNLENGNWVISSKNEYSIDSNGNETYYAYYSYDPATKKWDGMYKYESTYDSNGNETSSFYYDWDIYTGKWVVDSKSESTIDSNGNLSIITEYKRDETTGLLVLDSKTEPAWNNYYTDFILPDDWFDLSIFKHMLTGYEVYTWDSGSGKWTISEKDTFYYSAQNISGIHENTTSSVSIYPNPASELVTFDLKDASQTALIEFYDIQGKKVISQLLPVDKKLSVGQLKSGMYFYTVNQESKMYHGKIMIK